jgi:hypothetical protein
MRASAKDLRGLEEEDDDPGAAQAGRPITRSRRPICADDRRPSSPMVIGGDVSYCCDRSVLVTTASRTARGSF